MNTIAMVVGILVIIAIIGGAYWYSTRAPAPATTTVASSPASQGNVAYTISDAAASAVSSATMHVSSVQLQSSANGKWYTATPSGSGTYTLHGQTSYTFIGNATVPAGAYDAVQLNVDSVTGTYANGTTTTMAIPSDNITVSGTYDIQSTANTTSTNWINFAVDLNQSVHTTGSGKLILLPVVQVVAWSNAMLSVGTGNNVSVQSYGSVTSSVNAGMNVSGQMVANLVVPQDANLTVIGNVVISLG